MILTPQIRQGDVLLTVFSSQTCKKRLKTFPWVPLEVVPEEEVAAGLVVMADELTGLLVEPELVVVVS